MSDNSERKSKVAAYVKNLQDGDKVKFCGIYGHTDTFYYCGKILGKPHFSSSRLGIPIPLRKWKQNILLPEEWEENKSE